MVDILYGAGRPGQQLSPVDLTVGPIQVPVQLAPLFFGEPALMAPVMLTPLVALAAQGLARALLRVLPPLLLQQRAEARSRITCIRERRGEQRNSSSHQEQPLHQPVSVFRAAPCLDAAYCIIDGPAARPAGELLARLTHPVRVLIT